MTVRLSWKGMKVADDQPLKLLANQNNVQPLDLLKAALIEDYRPR